MKLEVGDGDPRGVELANHRDQPAAAGREAHPRLSVAAGARGGGAEAAEHLDEAITVGRIGGGRRDARLADLRLESGRRPLGDDLAAIDDADAIGEPVGLLEVLGGQKDGHPLLGGEPLDLLPERAAALRIEAGRRLVEEEDLRPVDERQREVEAALHAARVPADLAIGGIGQPDALDQLVAALPALILRDALERRLQPHVLAGGQMDVERRFLERRPDHAANPSAFGCDVVAADRGPAAGRRQQRRQHQYGRRLPGAVRPEEAVDLAGIDVEIDAVDRQRPLLELHCQALDFDGPLEWTLTHPRHPSTLTCWGAII